MADHHISPDSGRAPPPAQTGAPLSRYPALDGLRGLAVGGVLAFHGGFAWAKGGFLGVSAFFTLSGFLITTLLLAEHRRSGRIALRRFWARRFRRLLPASLVALAGVVVFGIFVADAEQAHALRGDGLAALGYVANWRFVFSGKSYASLFSSPSPLQHFWSLAIEEQFYVVFPLLVAAVLVVGRGSRRVLAGVLGGLAVASIGATFILYTPGFDPSRVYYGTDTRAVELLAGALLAIWVARGRRVVVGRAVARWSFAVRALGTIALGATIATWAVVDQTSTWLYQGGLAAIAITTCALIRASLEPAGLVRRALTASPLRMLGTISYGVYLYHWPIFLWLSARRTGLSPGPLFAIRIALTLAAAVASYHLIESPIRFGTRLRSGRRLVALPTIGIAIAAAFVVSTAQAPAPAITFSSSSVAHPAVAAAALPPAEAVAVAVPAKRVMVVGDSVGYVIGKGLERTGTSTGQLQTWDVAIPGCGIARRGDVIDMSGLRAHSTPGCNSWEERWARQLDEFPADVVVVMSGSWDMVPRKLPGWAAFRTIGDPTYDDWLVSEYQTAVDVLSARGARVVWLTSPCMHKPEGAQSGTFDPARTTHLDDTILARVAASRPAVMALVDLYGHVCPDKNFTNTVDGIPDARPDGVHFTDPAADALATWLTPQL